ncbi:MAG: hypothetical protein ACI8PZ_005651 [Myxococcota bacterium]|jgi:hypothetical protein
MRSLVLALLLPAPAFAISGAVSGTCPGPVDIDISSATPSGSVALLYGLGPGSDVVPAGPCAGTVSGLAGMLHAMNVAVDGAGAITMSPTLPPGACSRTIQFLDLTTCEMSDPIDLGALGGGGGAGLCDVNAVLFGMNDSEVLDDGWTTSSATHFAYTFTPGFDVLIDGAQLFTGESTAPASLEIWSTGLDDEPEARLVGGEWDMLIDNQWQGPAFDGPVFLSAGETYWLKMYSDDGYQTSRASSGLSVSYKWSSDLALWNGPFSNTDMFRLVDCL